MRIENTLTISVQLVIIYFCNLISLQINIFVKCIITNSYIKIKFKMILLIFCFKTFQLKKLFNNVIGVAIERKNGIIYLQILQIFKNFLNYIPTTIFPVCCRKVY